MMRGIHTLAAGIVMLSVNVFATSGIAVYGKDGSGALQYYGPQDGQLWRSIIEDDEITSQEKIFDGPCTRPVISPDGKTVAFIKNSGGAKISTISIDGGDVTELADCSPNSQIDFPSNDWIYFNLGSFHDDDSKTLKRVSPDGTVENVVTFSWRVAQIQISNDLTKAAIRTGDCCGTFTGTIVAYDMPGDGSDANNVGGGSAWSCAAGLFCDGEHLMDGDEDPHESMQIRNWDGSGATSYNNRDACSWPPNSNGWQPSTWNHSIFHTGGSTNDPKWLQIAIGGDRDYAGSGILLINPFDHQCIAPTADLSGQFDHGDFWVGDLTKATRDRGPVPTIKAQSFRVERGSKGVSVDIYSIGPHKVEIITASGSLVRTFRGAGPATYCLPARSIASGAYLLKVTTPTEQRVARMAFR